MKIGHSYYYTLDGTNPNKKSNKYLGKIDIKESTTIKLIGYNKNNESTEVLTLEYVIDKNIIKDVKSIITEGENLIKNTTVGTEVGNISNEDKDKLQFIISEAKDLVNQDSSSYENVSNIKNKLENGINEFKNNIVTDKSTALKAYYNFLKSYKFELDSSTRGFNLAYINNDSIPELIVFDGDYHAAGGKVYAYVNGKVTYVDEFGEWGVFEYQEKTGVIRSSWSGTGTYSTYYKWNGSKLSTIMSSKVIGEFSSNGDYECKYYINDKEVTLSKYESSIAPYEKGFKSVDVYNSYAVTDSVMTDKLLN